MNTTTVSPVQEHENDVLKFTKRWLSFIELELEHTTVGYALILATLNGEEAYTPSFFEALKAIHKDATNENQKFNLYNTLAAYPQFFSEYYLTTIEYAVTYEIEVRSALRGILAVSGFERTLGKS